MKLTQHAKKFLKFTIAASIIIGAFFTMATQAKAAKIAITQITSHASLDKVYQGTRDVLKEAGYSDKEILFANPQGDIPTAVQIAKKFVSHKPDIIIAIATPSAQTCLNAIKNKDIPLVFGTVSDPVSAGLVHSLQQPGKNVTGTRNTSPFAKQLALIKEVLPKTKKLGLVINSSEDNSVKLVEYLKELAPQYGLEIITAEAPDTGLVSSATRSIVKKVDALLLLQDNTIASALPALLQEAKKAKLPVFSTYVEAVEKGALMGLAFDEYQIGRQTGHIALRILRGEPAHSIPVEDAQKLELKINPEVAQNLQIPIPHPLQSLK